MLADWLLQGITVGDVWSWLIGQALIVSAFSWLIKVVVQKTVDSTISNSFSKNLEKYRDNLSRAAAARKLILDREMKYYGEFDDHLADLIPLLADLKASVEEERFAERERNYYKEYLEAIPVLKKLVLTYEPYIDRELYEASLSLVLAMQQRAGDWYAMAEILSSGEIVSEEVKAKATEMFEELLMHIAMVRHRQIAYIKELTG